MMQVIDGAWLSNGTKSYNFPTAVISKLIIID